MYFHFMFSNTGLDQRMKIDIALDPQTYIINKFIGIQMKRKELSKTFIIISIRKKHLVSMVYKTIFLRFMR